jgi:uncharacterized repeat protein (TIGR03803 family)
MRAILILAILAALLVPAQGHHLVTLYSFCPQENGCADGQYPNAGLVEDSAGDLFGTTIDGGSTGQGTVFELVAKASRTAWTFQKLYDFCSQSCDSGAQPFGGVILDTAGNLYGTTRGFNSFPGTVFELMPGSTGAPWTLVVLNHFCLYLQEGCDGGISPIGSLTYAGASSGAPYDGTSPLYGATELGGANQSYKISGGVVYSLTKNARGKWAQHVLHAFCPKAHCRDGNQPSAGIALDGLGDLYGVTAKGGTNNKGVVFRLSPAPGRKPWHLDVLKDFCTSATCNFEYTPYGAPIVDASGNVFTTAGHGGFSDNCPAGKGHPGPGCGTVFELFPADGGFSETVLYSFCPQTGCADGQGPSYLTLDGSGGLLGVTEVGGTGLYNGGAPGGGVVYDLRGGDLSVLYNFCSVAGCYDGQSPNGVMTDSAANIFGTTVWGGPDGVGTVFELIPD